MDGGTKAIIFFSFWASGAAYGISRSAVKKTSDSQSVAVGSLVTFGFVGWLFILIDICCFGWCTVRDAITTSRQNRLDRRNDNHVEIGQIKAALRRIEALPDAERYSTEMINHYEALTDRLAKLRREPGRRAGVDAAAAAQQALALADGTISQDNAALDARNSAYDG